MRYKDLGGSILRYDHLEDPDTTFPKQEDNRLYQEFLRWVSLGGVPEGPTLDEVKRKAKDAVTSHRWDVETGGITLPNGIAVKTGKADQDRITSVIANAQNAGINVVRFKGDGDVFVTIDFATVQLIAKAISLHVQACFWAEGDHYAAIDALQTADEVLDYDFSAGWPGPGELESMLGGGQPA